MIPPKPVGHRRSAYAVNKSGKPGSKSSLPRDMRPNRPGTNRQLLRKVVLGALIIVLGAAAFEYFQLRRVSSGAFSNGQGFSLSDLAASRSLKLKGEENGRTNIMLYGLTKDGLRTDTMLLVSYYWKEHKAVTLNIPRDLYANYDGYHGKIVSLYAVAKNSKPEERSYPPQFVSDFISSEYQIPIDYWVVANFDGLKEVVDSLGGIDVNNPTAFTDYQFPTDDYSGYMRPAPHFDAGNLHLSGNQALIYSRSRHSLTPGEGTDFARSKRQMDVIRAILTKLKTRGSLTDVTQINQFLGIFGQNIYTNLTPAELISLARTAGSLDFSKDYLKTSWDESSGFICSAVTGGGQDVLMYGVPGSCNGTAGNNSPSPYRQEALTYIQNLLSHGQP